MIITTASGIQIKIGRQAPLTNALKATINKLARKTLFPVNENDVVLLKKGLVATDSKKSSKQHRLRMISEEKSSPQSSCKKRFESPISYDELDTRECVRKYSPRGRNDRYKTNRHNRVAIW